jgi:hypothetical protein
MCRVLCDTITARLARFPRQTMPSILTKEVWRGRPRPRASKGHRFSHATTTPTSIHAAQKRDSVRALLDGAERMGQPHFQ